MGLEVKHRTVDQKILVTNPGYYRPIQYDADKKIYGYNYTTGALPDYKSVTGFAETRPPEATTSEEWLLVNNSDIYHPFHIHISPFFVEEVGQLNYNVTKQAWGVTKMTWDDKTQQTHWEPQDLPAQNRTFGWVVGNWWDTILIPPRGYVRFKTWINVPDQKPSSRHIPISPTDDVEPLDWTVTENTNVFGSWVLHCHILRHEDRGMMSMVQVMPKAHSLEGIWDITGATPPATPVKIIDDHGSLSGSKGAKLAYTGRFNEGIGNPLYSEPWVGTMSSDQGKTFLPFCAAFQGLQKTPYQVILSDGSSWLKQGNPVENDRPKSTTLAGDWIDNSGLNVKISQNPGDTQKWTFQPEPEPEPGSGVLWTVGDATWDQAATQATSPILNSFQGSVMFHDKKNGSKFQQILSFCVKNDLNTMIFGNGVRWTRKP